MLAVPLLALGVMIVAWGGLAPPNSQHTRPAAFQPRHVLYLAAAVGFWLWPVALHRLTGSPGRDRVSPGRIALAAALAASTLALDPLVVVPGQTEGLTLQVAERLAPLVGEAGARGLVVLLQAAGLLLLIELVPGTVHGALLAALVAVLLVVPQVRERYYLFAVPLLWLSMAERGWLQGRSTAGRWWIWLTIVSNALVTAAYMHHRFLVRGS